MVSHVLREGTATRATSGITTATTTRATTATNDSGNDSNNDSGNNGNNDSNNDAGLRGQIQGRTEWTCLSIRRKSFSRSTGYRCLPGGSQAPRGRRGQPQRSSPLRVRRGW